MWRGRPRPHLHPNAFPEFLGRKPNDTNHFSAAGLARGNGNGRSRYLQKSREEFDACVVPFAIDRRSGKRELKRVTKFAHDSVLLRAGMDFDCESHAAARFLDGNQALFPSENTVSTSSSTPTSATCGFASVRDFPMLAINATANKSIVTFAVMQNSLSPFTKPPLRMRSTFNIAVNSKAKPVPKIQILPV